MKPSSSPSTAGTIEELTEMAEAVVKQRLHALSSIVDGIVIGSPCPRSPLFC